jgi:hypothetical protein
MSLDKFLKQMRKRHLGRDDIFDFLKQSPKLTDTDEANKVLMDRWHREWARVTRKLLTKTELFSFEHLFLPFLETPTHFDSDHYREFIWLVQQQPGVEVYALEYPLLLVKFAKPRPDARNKLTHLHCVLGRSNSITYAHDFVLTIVKNRTKSDKGRMGWEFLLDRLRTRIAQIDEQSREDYKFACAISEDGEHIVRAERVYVVKAGSLPTPVDQINDPLFYFGQEKITRPRVVQRSTNENDVSVTDAIREVRKGTAEAFFLSRHDQRNRPSCFVVEAKYIPEVLRKAPMKIGGGQ